MKMDFYLRRNEHDCRVFARGEDAAPPLGQGTRRPRPVILIPDRNLGSSSEQKSCQTRRRTKAGCRPSRPTTKFGAIYATGNPRFLLGISINQSRAHLPISAPNAARSCHDRKSPASERKREICCSLLSCGRIITQPGRRSRSFRPSRRGSGCRWDEAGSSHPG